MLMHTHTHTHVCINVLGEVSGSPADCAIGYGFRAWVHGSGLSCNGRLERLVNIVSDELSQARKGIVGFHVGLFTGWLFISK